MCPDGNLAPVLESEQSRLATAELPDRSFKGKVTSLADVASQDECRIAGSAEHLKVGARIASRNDGAWTRQQRPHPFRVGVGYNKPFLEGSLPKDFSRFRLGRIYSEGARRERPGGSVPCVKVHSL